jgi:hypothetical protein
MESSTRDTRAMLVSPGRTPRGKSRDQPGRAPPALKAVIQAHHHHLVPHHQRGHAGAHRRLDERPALRRHLPPGRAGAHIQRHDGPCQAAGQHAPARPLAGGARAGGPGQPATGRLVAPAQGAAGVLNQVKATLTHDGQPAVH